ncbi:peptidase dimerization domain-containing protein [Sphingomonas sp. MMS24-JH45]
MLVGDQERSGEPVEVARRDLIAAAKTSDVALEFEGGVRDEGKDFGTVARRGSITWEVKTTGETGHSSVVFGPIGYGAIYEATRIADAFRRELREPSLTYNIGLMAGGTPVAIDADGVRATASGKPNIIASGGDARRPARAEPRTGRAGAGEDARDRGSAPARHRRHHHLQRRPSPMAPDPRNDALLAALNRANRDLSLPQMAPWDPAKRGASDAGSVSPHIGVLAGVGAIGGGAHAAGEWVDLTSIPRQALRAAVLMGRLAGEPRR